MNFNRNCVDETCLSQEMIMNLLINRTSKTNVFMILLLLDSMFVMHTYEMPILSVLLEASFFRFISPYLSFLSEPKNKRLFIALSER